MEGERRGSPAAHPAPRLVEVVAALSLAGDLGLGQPMEHTLRSCLIATRLAEELDFKPDERDAIYWVALLAMVGCTANSSEVAETFGDDIDFRRTIDEVGGPSEQAMPRYLLSRADSGNRPPRGARASTAPGVTSMDTLRRAWVANCTITGRFAERLGLGEAVSLPLQLKFARWDGTGIPPNVAGYDIPLAARMLGLSWRTEVAHRQRGTQAANELLGEQAGAALDPELAAAVAPSLPAVLEGLEEDSWSAVVDAEPARTRLMGEGYDAALEALADFADLKSPWFTGHSRAVTNLAEAAAWRLGLEDAEVDRLRRAGLVHSLGRTGVPNTIWDKKGELSVSERERMQLYPYLTDRILRHGSLSELAGIASASQERLDGSGYPRGLSGSATARAGRILAAADVYQALREDRPHRPALPESVAVTHLRDQVRDGVLEAEAANAVLHASGHRTEGQRTAPADLTQREVDVLRLIARGRTSAQAAGELGIQPKTVGTHIEHIYAKIGASNRSVATLFAMEHGLV